MVESPRRGAAAARVVTEVSDAWPRCPTYRPTFTPAQVRDCERLVRQQNAPQVQVARAKLALLLHAQPALDNVTAARRLGKHANWVRYWRKRWATGGFRLTDRAGTRAQARFFPLGRWPRSRRWPANCRPGVSSR